MAPTYKLHYFNVRGVAEPIRLIFAYTGVKYEDIRIEKENWPSMKNGTRFGKLPYLEIDDQILTQSTVICRYLAQQNGLTGKDALESLRCDEIVATLGDVGDEMRAVMRAQDGKEKEEVREKLLSEKLPFYYERFDKIAAKNGGLIVGKQLTWADIFLAHILAQIESVFHTCILSKYPSLQALKDKVFAEPGIAEWIKKRPQTVM